VATLRGGGLIEKMRAQCAQIERLQCRGNCQVPSLGGLCDSARGKFDNHFKKIAHAAQTFTVSNTDKRR